MKQKQSRLAKLETLVGGEKTANMLRFQQIMGEIQAITSVIWEYIEYNKDGDDFKDFIEERRRKELKKRKK